MILDWMFVSDSNFCSVCPKVFISCKYKRYWSYGERGCKSSPTLTRQRERKTLPQNFHNELSVVQCDTPDNRQRSAVRCLQIPHMYMPWFISHFICNVVPPSTERNTFTITLLQFGSTWLAREHGSKFKS